MRAGVIEGEEFAFNVGERHRLRPTRTQVISPGLRSAARATVMNSVIGGILVSAFPCQDSASPGQPV